jgi:hypothetical protein
MLKGKKTYIIVIIGVIVNGLYALGHIPTEWIPVANSILAFLGLGALRAGVAGK